MKRFPNINGREYAQVGDRLYTEHAVNRMQPSGTRYRDGGAIYNGKDVGRSISPSLVDDVIKNGSQTTVTTSAGVARTVHKSGSIEVITEQNGHLVVTINPFKVK